MKKRHFILFVLMLLSVITYVDRLCISVAGPAMQKDLGLSPSQWGWVMGAFALTYALFEIPSGAWGDAFEHKQVVTRIVIWWSCFTGLTGLVRRFDLLVAVRALFGMGEAGAYPNISGCIGRWFPATERARAQGLVWAASRVGGALSPVLVVPLIHYIGWRESFLVFGYLGIIWAVGWQNWYYNDPTQYPNITESELEEIRAGGSPFEHRRIPWGKIFGNLQVWLIMAMYWSYVWGSMFYLTWFPTYLVKGRGFTSAEMALCVPLPFILGAIGNVVGGAISDALARRYGIKYSRRWVGSTCLGLSALCLFLTSATTGKFTGVLYLTLGFGIMDCMLPSAWAMCLDIGKNYAGAISGAMNSAGNLGGFVFSVVFGYLVDYYAKHGLEPIQQYNRAVLVVGVLVLISAGLFLSINPEHKIEEGAATQS